MNPSPHPSIDTITKTLLCFNFLSSSDLEETCLHSPHPRPPITDHPNLLWPGSWRTSASIANRTDPCPCLCPLKHVGTVKTSVPRREPPISAYLRSAYLSIPLPKRVRKTKGDSTIPPWEACPERVRRLHPLPWLNYLIIPVGGPIFNRSDHYFRKGLKGNDLGSKAGGWWLLPAYEYQGSVGYLLIMLKSCGKKKLKSPFLFKVFIGFSTLKKQVTN